jgi:hypothetical protein
MLPNLADENSWHQQSKMKAPAGGDTGRGCFLDTRDVGGRRGVSLKAVNAAAIERFQKKTPAEAGV